MNKSLEILKSNTPEIGVRLAMGTADYRYALLHGAFGSPKVVEA